MAPEGDTDLLVTPAEAADLLRTSRRVIYRKIASGQLPAIRTGTAPSAPLRIPLRALIASVHPAAPLERKDARHERE